MWEGLAKGIGTLDADPDVRVIVLRGSLAENLLEETVALAKSIAEKAPLSVAGTKRVANRVARGEDIVSIFDGLEPARKAWISADFAEGVRAYLEKRPPAFRGK